jgi:hypothetical protein
MFFSPKMRLARTLQAGDAAQRTNQNSSNVESCKIEN